MSPDVLCPVRGLIGTDLARGSRLRRAVAIQMRILRRGSSPDARRRLGELRAAWGTPSVPNPHWRLALTLPLLWQAHIELYARMLGRRGVLAPKSTLAEMVGVQPRQVSRWLQPDRPSWPDWRSRELLTALMPDIRWPGDWR